MLCQNCQARLPLGRVLCPGCSHLNTYNVKGHANTKAVQTALRTMISEQGGNIADTRQFAAVMYDYLPEYDTERRLLIKAVNAGFLDEMIGAPDQRAAFNGLRSSLMHDNGFSRGDAEFVLACFGQMLGFAYVSSMFEDDTPAEQNDTEKEKNKVRDRSGVHTAVRPKPFGKLEAFKYALSAKVLVREGFTELPGYCFENFGLMKEISLPSTLSVIGEYAFSDCKNLESVVIPGGVRKLDKGVFNACVGLKKVTLPEELLAIGSNCFFCCTSLRTLRVPDSVSSIGENAFSGCASLEELTVPKNVKFIDTNAFSYCGKLTVVCTENSFVHKYCMQNKIKYRSLPAGVKLPGGDETEDSLDE